MVLLFFSGFALGILVNILYPQTYIPNTQIRERGYEYINPLIDFETVASAKKYELNHLGNRLEKYYNSLIKNDSNKGTLLSIYYKDMNSGAWVGINENRKFEPASLLKVPMIIVNYKIAQENPSHLDLKTKYKVDSASSPFKQNVVVENELTEGQEYTLDEYIDQLIIYSDNNVLEEIEELYRKGTRESEFKIYSDLGLENPYTTNEYNVISPKEYSSFFRILYNATFLNKEMSSKALELLTRTTYDRGLRAGVPEEIKIAKKFGERGYTSIIGNDLVQLHDCGIIYHPLKPYILCVMTQGKSISHLETIITDISSMVFETVDSR